MTKYTKQTYQVVADVLRAEWYASTAGRHILRNVMNGFIEKFSEDNPRFDPGRFEAEIDPDKGYHIRDSIGDAPRMR